MKITRLEPEVALPGGVVRIGVTGLKDLVSLKVYVGEAEATIVGASTQLLTVRVPADAGQGIQIQSGSQKAKAPLLVGTVVAEEVHPVTKPAVDSLGNVYVTYSGTRGEEVPFGVFVVSPEGVKKPFLGDITNATGLAIGPDSKLYISSRHSGTIFRSSFDRQIEKFCENLGLATGIAFSSKGELFVGDRSGVIYRITEGGQASVLCELEPSVSAFHLAVDSDDVLYVTAPTLATQDAVYRVSMDGEVEVLFKGFGRPQGITFDGKGTLLVAASFRGRRGLFKLSDRTPTLSVAGPMLIGAVVSENGETLYLVDNQRLYQVPLSPRSTQKVSGKL